MILVLIVIVTCFCTGGSEIHILNNDSESLNLHLYFRVEGRSKERGLYPPSSLCRRTHGVGSCLKLEVVNEGVVSSLFFDPKNTNIWSFLYV